MRLITHPPNDRGFSLIEMALVLLILGILSALFLPMTNTMMDYSRRKETQGRLGALEQAMTRFVIATGRLPCPADGALLPANPNYGRELRTAATGVCTTTNRGVVPWITLGLPLQDAIDAWQGLISYRVRGNLAAGPASIGLTLDRALDMTVCDPAGAAVTTPQTPTGGQQRLGCNPACTTPFVSGNCTAPANWLNTRGLRVDADVAGLNTLMNPTMPTITGAAYVLISHGANRFGSYDANGNFINTARGAGPGPRENLNTNNAALRVAPNAYIDGALDETPVDYFDDIVARPSLMSLILAAGLGPRTH